MSCYLFTCRVYALMYSAVGAPTDNPSDCMTLIPHCSLFLRVYIQVVPTKVEVNQNYLGDRAFSTYQMVASSQIMMVRQTTIVCLYALCAEGCDVRCIANVTLPN
jgi:hypothetical protein